MTTTLCGPARTQIGDMLVIGRPAPRLLAGLEAMALNVHRLFDMNPAIRKGGSKESCILSALTAADFLRTAGFPDARVVSVAAALRTEQLTVGVGFPDGPEAPRNKWRGHLVAIAGGYLVDLAMYPLRRPQWPFIKGMVAVPIAGLTLPPINGLAVLAGFNVERSFSMAWLSNEANDGWRAAPDAERSLRAPVVAALGRHAGISANP